MTHLHKIFIAGCLISATGIAVAQEDGLFTRLELRSHTKLATTRDGAELLPFTTDGCSGGLSATWKVVAYAFPKFEDIHMQSPPWESCCVTHDRAYHLGGQSSEPKDSFAARLEADKTLEACVISTSDNRRDELRSQYDMTDPQIDMAYQMIGAAMYDSVRFGGGPCSGLPWRWGYGWPHCLVTD